MGICIDSRYSGVTVVVTTKGGCPSGKSTEEHNSQRCLHLFLSPTSHTSLLFRLYPPLAAHVNKAIHLIIALYFTLSPPKGLPAFRLLLKEGCGTVSWQSYRVITSSLCISSGSAHIYSACCSLLLHTAQV